jgi:hypothetical protein
MCVCKTCNKCQRHLSLCTCCNYYVNVEKLLLACLHKMKNTTVLKCESLTEKFCKKWLRKPLMIAHACTYTLSLPSGHVYLLCFVQELSYNYTHTHWGPIHKTYTILQTLQTLHTSLSAQIFKQRLGNDLLKMKMGI